MISFWKYFFLFFFILAVPLAAYFGYRSYHSLKNPSSPGFTAITPRTPIIIEFLEPKAFTEKLTGQTHFWDELTILGSVGQLHKSIQQIDSILSSQSQVRGIFEKNKLFLCFHLTQSDKIEPLFIQELPSVGYKFTIENFIKEVNGENSFVIQKKFKNVSITRLNIPGLERFFNFAIHKGIFIGAFDELLVREALDQMIGGIPVNQDEQFKKLQVSAGVNVDANIFLNYSTFSDLGKILVNKNYYGPINNLKKMGNWSETDMILKPNELLLSGYTMTSNDGSQLLDLFRQEPQTIRIPEILPFDVAVVFHFGFEEFKRFHDSRIIYRQKNHCEKEADSILLDLKKQTGLNVPEFFYPWIGREAVLATTGETGDTAANRYVIIHALDVKAASDSVSRLVNFLVTQKKKKNYSEEFEDYTLGYLDLSGLFPALFGSLFNGAYCPYYFTIRDYMVFANSPGALKYLIANFYAQKTLAVNPNFRSFSNGISDKSNIFFYCNTRKSLNTVAGILNDELADLILSHSNTFRTFEGIAVQYSHTSGMFYTSIYLRHNPDYVEELPSGWEAELAGKVYSKPMLIRNEETGKLNVAAFDDLNNMYLTDHFGKIVWKTPLIESPMSEIFLVDAQRNGKKQFLFNTQNYLYLIDQSGNYVGDYPVKLFAPATNSISLIDDENGYRIWVALSDNRIYQMDIGAKPADGWQRVSIAQQVISPVDHLLREGKEYLFVTDEVGNVTIVNNKGLQTIKLKKGLKKARNSPFYVNQTNSKGLFLTTDTKGKLTYIDENGRLDYTDFGDYTEDHFFLYEDLSNNEAKDFIFIDGNQLKVFDRFKEVIIEYEFPGSIVVPPIYFRSRNGELLLGLVAAGKVYIFNKHGEVFRGNNFRGNTGFVTGSLNNDGRQNLVIGDGSKLINYLLD